MWKLDLGARCVHYVDALTSPRHLHGSYVSPLPSVGHRSQQGLRHVRHQRVHSWPAGAPLGSPVHEPAVAPPRQAPRAHPPLALLPLAEYTDTGGNPAPYEGYLGLVEPLVAAQTVPDRSDSHSDRR